MAGTDEKLGREVALKVLPADFAADPDRLARFEREAKVLASLNHPNIAHLYGLENREHPNGSRDGCPIRLRRWLRRDKQCRARDGGA